MQLFIHCLWSFNEWHIVGIGWSEGSLALGRAYFSWDALLESQPPNVSTPFFHLPLLGVEFGGLMMSDIWWTCRSYWSILLVLMSYRKVVASSALIWWFHQTVVVVDCSCNSWCYFSFSSFGYCVRNVVTHKFVSCLPSLVAFYVDSNGCNSSCAKW